MKIFMFRINGRELPVCASTVDEAFKRAERLYQRYIPSYLPKWAPNSIQGAEVYAEVCQTASGCGFIPSTEYSVSE